MVSLFRINNSLQDELEIKMIGELVYLIKEAHNCSNKICKYHPQRDGDSILKIHKITYGGLTTNLVLFKPKAS